MNKRKTEKEVKEYISNLTGIEYNKLCKYSRLFKKVINTSDYTFTAYKYIKNQKQEISFSQIYHIYYGLLYPPKTPTLITERYIRRNGIIDKLSNIFKEEDEIYNMIAFAETLDEVIGHKLISLENLWYMEYGQEHDISLNEGEQAIYDYFKLFALIYLQFTNELCRKYEDSEQVIDYKEDIDNLVKSLFGKEKDKTMTKK